MNEERRRVAEANENRARWRRWGPYLSERQWGTVREDLSPGGDAWDYFPHDHARSRAYLRGEDGIAGVCDDGQLLCFAVAFHNGVDPILKERLFGLANNEGNHGEDVKELYYYLDSTPTHSFMRYLYKYPQAPYPYSNLVETNAARGRTDPEYELIDTGVFDDDRYFDIEVVYAKASPEDMLIEITVTNRGDATAPITVLPTLWYRNRWTLRSSPRPSLRAVEGVIEGEHHRLGRRQLRCDAENATLLFCENETNTERLFSTPNRWPHPKDAFNDYVVDGRKDAVNPGQVGTKAAFSLRLEVAPGATERLRLRLQEPSPAAFEDFDAILAKRREEANTFYNELMSPSLTEDERLVFRQAMAGMLWTKQYYTFDVAGWLAERGEHPLQAPVRDGVRNVDWFHMVNGDVISMPDKWEYPWYAAWDLAFHCVTMAHIDPAFAKAQLVLLLREWYIHPNGQLPAYEWNFSDVNPPT
ncbi:MAG: glucosidase, partial [Myxococcota bacterium]